MDDSQIAGRYRAGRRGSKSLDDRSVGAICRQLCQRQLQRLTEELPTHYRDVIEGYFRQLAKDRTSR